MCGVAAVIGRASYNGNPTETLQTLVRSLDHRGPDDSGLWVAENGRVGLGHTRLSIIDLTSSGHQPMASHDGRYQIVFNGEIYNYPSLRSELERAGVTLRSTSDTEVLIESIALWGLDALHRLQGMFAFALYDGVEDTTYLVRDPLGIKPLYTLEHEQQILVASEIAALTAVVPNCEIDVEAVGLFLNWGSIPPPRTLWREIRAVPAGTIQEVSVTGLRSPTQYFDLSDCFARPMVHTEAEAADLLADALGSTVDKHLIADVPVGLFLSGGVDSSALLALATERHDEITTVTLELEDSVLDESDIARRTASYYGSDHKSCLLSTVDAKSILEHSIAALDQPSIDGVNSFFVARAAAGVGLKAVLSGVGGDELFGGYSSFERVPRARKIAQIAGTVPGGRPAVARGARLLGMRYPEIAERVNRAASVPPTMHGGYFAMRSMFSTCDVEGLLTRDAVTLTVDPIDDLARRIPVDGLTPRDAVSALEFGEYLRSRLLRDADAVSMRSSLEVRTPLVDSELLRTAGRVSAELRQQGPHKRQLRNAPNRPVPEYVWNQKKRGFTIPLERWIRDGDVAITLPQHEMFDQQQLRNLELDIRRSGTGFMKLWALHVLGSFIGGQSCEGAR